jgi:predicted lipid-binding transport protein (Tim44 family)
MTLKTLIVTLLALTVAALLSLPQPAEAKRFGGGGNMGRQYSMPRQAQPPRQTQAPAALPGQRPPQASGASRWLGPLAGLAAGGLLASMFMGDSFQGFQIMDFLLIAALAVGGFMLWRMLRRGQAGARPGGAFAGAAPAVAGADPFQRQAPRDFLSKDSGPAQHDQGRGLLLPAMGEDPPQPAGSDRFPYWFDGPAFIERAKTHFIRLQAAWDQSDLRDIREYTTPQMFAEIQRERERLGGAQYTEVVRLQAELVTIQQYDDLAVASVRFSGLVREDEQGVANEFREIWHVQHVWDRPEGDWLIAGIQQE